MIKIYPVVDHESDWYPKYSFQSFMNYSKRIEITKDPLEADIIWIYSYYVDYKIPLKTSFFNKIKNKLLGKKKIIITTFHHLTPWKEHLFIDKVKELDGLSDYIHFFSNKNLEINRKYFTKKMIQLPYWIDSKYFFPLNNDQKKNLRQNYSIPLEKIIIGNFQRDTESNLSSPKLEKGPDKFCEIIESLDKAKYFILLCGSRRNYIENRLSAAGINFLNLGKISFEKMNDLYNIIDYYFVTSRVEGGPQAILESMATKTKIFSTPVGISSILHENIICKKNEDFKIALNSEYSNNIVEAHYKKVLDEYNCSKVVDIYEKKFKNLLDV